MAERERDYPETVAHARSIIAKLDPAAPAKGKRMRTIVLATLALVVLFILIGLSVGISVANGNANRLAHVPTTLEIVATQVDQGGRNLPRDTVVTGSLQDGQSVSYIDPKTGDSLGTVERDLPHSYRHEVSGVLGEYTITSTVEVGGKEHRFVYDSTTDRITESIQEEKN